MSELHLSRIVSQAVRDHGNHIAVRSYDGEFTYNELNERVLKLANGLHDLGVQAGDRVAVLMLNDYRYLELYLACAISNIVVVPLNIRWGAQEFSHALMDSTPKVFAIDGVILEHLKPYIDAIKMMGIEHLLYADKTAPEGMVCHDTVIAEADAKAIPGTFSEDDLYGLFYTSGTTGNPKGVMLTHKNIFTNAYHAQMIFKFRPGAVYLHAAPMFHLADGSATFTLTWIGGTHAFLPRFEEEAFFKAVQDFKATSSVLVPTMINFITNHPKRTEYDLSSLEEMIYGASPMPLEVLKGAVDAFGTKFLQGYGMTEASPLVTALSADDHDAGLAGQNSDRLGSAGQPIPGVEVRIVDEDGKDVPDGEVGEVLVRGANVMQGYWNLPDATAEVLDADGWYHSRDMGRMDEHRYLTLVDRKGDMIVSGGENIYSTEIEDILYQHEAVLEACVIGVTDPKWVEAVKAVVVVKEGQTLTEEDIIAHCKENLSPYKIPKSVSLVNELPKGGTGKILKHVLRDQFARDS
jgi:long-chain acyl-CoA synthetase